MFRWAQVNHECLLRAVLPRTLTAGFVVNLPLGTDFEPLLSGIRPLTNPADD
jgi:hypothetical protein